jgi:uncharacterized protein (TIGR02246 family)
MRISHLLSVAGLAGSMAMSAAAQPPAAPADPSRSSRQPGISRPADPSSTDRQAHQRGTLNDADERMLRDRVTSFVAALNQHDSSAVGPFLASDADLVTPGGKLIQGRDSIETMMSSKSQKGENCKLDLRVSSIRGFGDVAIVDLDGTVTGVPMGMWWRHDGDTRGPTDRTPRDSRPHNDRGTPDSSAPNAPGAPGTPGTSPSGDPNAPVPPAPDRDGRPTPPPPHEPRDGGPHSGGPGMGMGDGGSFKAHVTLVMHRERNEWLIEAGRPTVLPMGGGGPDDGAPTFGAPGSMPNKPGRDRTPGQINPPSTPPTPSDPVSPPTPR